MDPIHRPVHWYYDPRSMGCLPASSWIHRPVHWYYDPRSMGCLPASSWIRRPVHWYYDPNQIKRSFGYITDYQAPQATHPSSIMSVSNTGGLGRGGQAGRIVGDVINHGKVGG